MSRHELRHSATSLIKKRRRSTRQAEGKTTLLGVGWIFPHCRWTDTGGQKQKHPEDQIALRVMCNARSLMASARAMAAARVTITVTVMPSVARRDVNHWRRAIPHRRAVHDGWRIIRHGRHIPWRRHHDRRREVHRRAEGNTHRHRPTRLRRGGEPSQSNHCDQTEKRFCFHARFDGAFNGVFSGWKNRDVFWREPVTEKVRENE
jgi:hypothetical protein